MTKELVMTCRRFGAAEAKALGFVNRVVPPARLVTEVEELARELIAKPSVPVAITKEHVNAVTRAANAGLTPYADGDVLMSTLGEEESRAAARAYREKILGKR
jgi:enoyl-CoA hydratase/carnithine racemase